MTISKFKDGVITGHGKCDCGCNYTYLFMAKPYYKANMVFCRESGIKLVDGNNLSGDGEDYWIKPYHSHYITLEPDKLPVWYSEYLLDLEEMYEVYELDISDGAEFLDLGVVGNMWSRSSRSIRNSIEYFDLVLREFLHYRLHRVSVDGGDDLKIVVDFDMLDRDDTGYTLDIGKHSHYLYNIKKVCVAYLDYCHKYRIPVILNLHDVQRALHLDNV